MAESLRALSDETRLRVLALLSTGAWLCVCELVSILRLPHYGISRHLNMLKRSGLLVSRREGTYVFYSLAASVRKERAMKAILRQLDSANRQDPILRDDAARLKQVVQLRTRQDRLTAYCERVGWPVEGARGLSSVARRDGGRPARYRGA